MHRYIKHFLPSILVCTDVSSAADIPKQTDERPDGQGERTESQTSSKPTNGKKNVAENIANWSHTAQNTSEKPQVLIALILNWRSKFCPWVIFDGSFENIANWSHTAQNTSEKPQVLIALILNWRSKFCPWVI